MFFSTPLLRAVNLSIAVLALALLATAFWFTWRPLPETSGEIAAPIRAKAEVVRDSLGVPHIHAESWEDAIFLQGYATAQDRLWQLDAERRFAAGELAEIVGPTALETDREAHRLRLRRLAESEEKNLTPASRAIFAAYARGVNYFIETHRDRLPLEFTLLRYEPRPWRISDSLLVGLQMARELTNSWRDDLNKQKMLEKGDPAKVSYLWPERTGGESQPGSNAWAVSGAHTASGKPILANDPHLVWGAPATWWQVHLVAPDLDVAGMSLPGLPAVILGHNRKIAWGMTNLGYDVEDLFTEQINLQTGQYLYQGRVEQGALERDVIAVKGALPVESFTYMTRQGPVFLNEDNRNYVLRWSPTGAEAFDYPFLDLDRASNWKEFNEVLARFPGPSQNFVYADVEGNIGYHAAGQLPIRSGCRGDVPADGSKGDCEWKGYIPYDELP